jgi:superfamily II DNA or RNA helicase
MIALSEKYIRESIANSEVIFKRGENIYHLGNYALIDSNIDIKQFIYSMDGHYGEYTIQIDIQENRVLTNCECPYPGNGCKHVVAACLDVNRRLKKLSSVPEKKTALSAADYLSGEEIREEAFKSRKKKATSESFKLELGDTFKGEHRIITKTGRVYIATVHEPQKKAGHCTCADFSMNRLGICKHLIFLFQYIKKQKIFDAQADKERFPFIHIFWNSIEQKPQYFYDRKLPEAIQDDFKELFEENGLYKMERLGRLFEFYEKYRDDPKIKFDTYLLIQINHLLFLDEVKKIKETYKPDFSFLKTKLLPYQEKGIRFALFKRAAIIADEMGLGKTLQAITLAVLKKQLFGFSRILVVTPASLKFQWLREIEKFTDETAVVVEGNKRKRQQIYETGNQFFKITNYEAVLRDILVLKRFKPQLVILDEAQRIKNFETKTHQAIISIPHEQSLVITGTPLENKLEDIYAIMQFSRPGLLSPLWMFASNHFYLSRSKKNKILGYKNLEPLYEKLKKVVIRRKKEEVFDSLPDQMVNNYFLDLSKEQAEIHTGYVQSLFPIINKKFLTPIDIRKIQQLLLLMRMVCNSTYLIDKMTNISPKLGELTQLLFELVIENKRKIVIFSEWTNMTYLIGKTISNMDIPFIEYTGRIPVAKRHLLIDEFNNNPDCKIFLSTDAGGTGLNLQSADCVINFELPWNPARLNQRIGRVNRIGQKSNKVNVINLITKRSIEEKVFAGINLKQELFNAVLDGSNDEVLFSRDNKTKFINQIRAMFSDEQEAMQGEKNIPDELDNDTPYFLNPKVLDKEEAVVDISMEEGSSEEEYEPAEPVSKDEIAANTTDVEKMEQVLNQGLQFLSSLSVMAGGKPIITGNDKNAIRINRETGEVTFKFKMAGF